jgi:hypothetical protein
LVYIIKKTKQTLKMNFFQKERGVQGRVWMPRVWMGAVLAVLAGSPGWALQKTLPQVKKQQAHGGKSVDFDSLILTGPGKEKKDYAEKLGQQSFSYCPESLKTQVCALLGKEAEKILSADEPISKEYTDSIKVAPQDLCDFDQNQKKLLGVASQRSRSSHKIHPEGDIYDFLDFKKSVERVDGVMNEMFEGEKRGGTDDEMCTRIIEEGEGVLFNETFENEKKIDDESKRGSKFFGNDANFYYKDFRGINRSNFLLDQENGGKIKKSESLKNDEQEKRSDNEYEMCTMIAEESKSLLSNEIFEDEEGKKEADDYIMNVQIFGNGNNGSYAGFKGISIKDLHGFISSQMPEGDMKESFKKNLSIIMKRDTCLGLSHGKQKLLKDFVKGSSDLEKFLKTGFDLQRLIEDLSEKPFFPRINHSAMGPVVEENKNDPTGNPMSFLEIEDLVFNAAIEEEGLELQNGTWRLNRGPLAPQDLAKRGVDNSVQISDQEKDSLRLEQHMNPQKKYLDACAKIKSLWIDSKPFSQQSKIVLLRELVNKALGNMWAQGFVEAPDLIGQDLSGEKSSDCLLFSGGKQGAFDRQVILETIESKSAGDLIAGPFISNREEYSILIDYPGLFFGNERGVL